MKKSPPPGHIPEQAQSATMSTCEDDRMNPDAAETKSPDRAGVLRLLAHPQTSFNAEGELEVISSRLHLASLKLQPKPSPQKIYVKLSGNMQYLPFCADFGPNNLGAVHSICAALEKLIIGKEIGPLVVLYTSKEPEDVTNAVFLLGAFLCLKVGASPEQAWRPFMSLDRGIVMPYRDATWVKSTYDLHLQDCWAGLLKAVATGLYSPSTFNKNEYFYYDNPAHGDMHMVVPGKFLAFRGPCDKDCRGSLRPSALVDVFKVLAVAVIVRLNEAEYDNTTFLEAGFEHTDLIFQDCSVPPSNIIDAFLRRAEELEEGQVLAVHCLAGLGRSGTLIALYMMKHHRFTANEAIGWLRIARPGSIIGPQQRFLASQESRMHELGEMGIAGLGEGLPISPKRTPSTSLAKTHVLADMVIDGMKNRTAKRMAQVVLPSNKADKPTRSTLSWLEQHAAGKDELSKSTPGAGLARLKERLRSPPQHTKSLSSIAELRHKGGQPGAGTPNRVPAGKMGHSGRESLKKSGSFHTMSSRQDGRKTLLPDSIRCSSSSPSGVSTSPDEQLYEEEEAQIQKQVEEALSRKAAGGKVRMPQTMCFKGSRPETCEAEQADRSSVEEALSRKAAGGKVRMPQTMCFKGSRPETCEAEQASLHPGKHTKDNMAQAQRPRSLSDVATAPAAFAAQTSAFTAIRRIWESPEADASPSHTLPETGPMLPKLRSASGLIDGIHAGRAGTT